MASSDSWKLRALLKKNLLILKRNIVSTLCEILFPLVLIIISLGIRLAFKLKKYNFTDVEGSLGEFIQERSMGSPDLTDSDIDKEMTWFGISILPALKICSPYNNTQHKIRPLIASIGLPDKVKQQMIDDSVVFQDSIHFNLSDKSFKEFNDINELSNYIKDPKYGQVNYPLICFGASFKNNNGKYEYSLHYFDTSIGDGIEDIKTTSDGLFDSFQSGPDFESWDLYQQSGYIYMMKLINEYILQQETNSNKKLNVGIIPMKYIDYREDPFTVFIGYMIPFFIVIAYMCPLCLYVYRMVSEKENKSKEGMKIMGLNEGTYFLSYFIQYLVIAIIDTLINSLILSVLFKKIPFLVLFLIIFLFAMDVFALIFFFQSFIDKTRVALILSLLIYFVMYFISMACMSEYSAPSLKYILSLLPPVCIELGITLIAKFECHFRQFHLRDYTKTYTNYCIGLMNLMQLIDFFLYLFLGYYLQNVLPHEFGIRKPWYFIFTSKYWCKSDHRNNKKKKEINSELEKENIENVIYVNENLEINVPNSQKQKLKKLNNKIKKKNSDSKNFQGEELYKDKIKPNDALRIKNIVKIFGDGKKAVDKVNLNLYKDEIFALLGHNGAGKTTLISMLTGLYEATEGEAFFDGYDILESGNMDKFRCKLGICPQHDVLFDDLTIKEHLEMFCIFKGYSSNIEDNVNKTMEDFGLSSIQNIIAKNLSAGQRRKLSIAISLIGGSEVIFLDEPSSGMDITSRRNLWEILKRQAERKIIILTTHYMEEASVLGNRIGIINSGKMKCIGTPLFLIEKFGKFLSLNITKEDGADNIKIVDFIQKMAQNVEFEILSEEIIFRIPKSNYINSKNISTEEGLSLSENNSEKHLKDNKNSNNTSNISKFFEELDKNLQNLKIKSYSASMPTLEDVFLNVAAEDNKSNKLHRAFSAPRNEEDKILFQTNFKEDYSKKSKFYNDFNACFHRRFLLTIRDIKGILMEILCPILLCIVGLIVSQVDVLKISKPQKMNMSYIGKQKILYGGPINNLNDYHFENMANITCENIDFTFGENNKITIQNFMEKIYNDYTINSEDSINHEVDMMSNNYIGYYGSLLILDNSDNKINFVEILNPRVKHCLPIYSYFFMKKIIEVEIGKEINIDFTHYPFPLTAELEEERDQTNNSLVVFFVAIAFALIPANFVTIIVKEKINNSKHLMRVSGINIAAYWIVNFIFELIKYYITCGICILLLWAFSFYKNYLYILYIIYGPSMIILTYLSSFIFQSESVAQNVTILINFLLGSLGATVIIMFRALESTKIIAIVLQYIISLLPSFCFNVGFDILLNKIMIYQADYPNEWFYFKENVVIKKFNLLLGPIIFLCAEFIIYTIILSILEYLAYKGSNVPDKKLDSSNINDSQVLKEIDLVNDKNSNLKEYAVRIKNLKKNYNMGCCGGEEVKAIKNMNFCLKPGECFGLLGLNGAGKTTTFKCITQEISPSNGKIFINGKDMKNNFNELSNIFGYCPQFDAIFEYMTVYENLEFYAKIKGVKRDLLNQVINAMIKEMSLSEFTNKIAGRLSGGNKRKLSVAISFLCNPSIVLLDEPSTGMDPEARRFMWSVIHKISANNSSIIMTTHSMDEAETLCKRMGIMVNGEFVCLGKANQIKEKYGYGYEIDVRIKPIPEKILNETLNNSNFDKKLKINKGNVKDVLMKLKMGNYIDELKQGRFGSKINRDISIGDGIFISALISWVFYVENALKFIKSAKNYFDEIILTEHIDNNFLFKIKKGNNTKSIGFLFGIFEKNKEECNVTEYSIQQTSLEQIFNQFASKQSKINSGNENINKDKDKNSENNQKEEIVINDDVYNKLLI